MKRSESVWYLYMVRCTSGALYTGITTDIPDRVAKHNAGKGAKADPRPAFSEVSFAWGNSFIKKEHMMQARLGLVDSKYGFFIETGLDVRPVLRTVTKQQNDTLRHQYRERRLAWVHGAGKYFRLVRDSNGAESGVYLALYGMLSFPSYAGVEKRPGAEYDLVPSFGVFYGGDFAGIKAGLERYRFNTLSEQPWKINITLYLRIK